MTTPIEQASGDLLDSRPSAPADNQREPIPGYVLKERIGTGGYGEVWKAEAPGGLLKAVKFVYGTLDDAAASRELEALEQIKSVHHPLLLSLERIEIIDGRLVIVSELAGSSLKDRFEACRESGLDGIPRDELLRYLRDAADALDYLYEEHSLQHLDIKPENLLLVGNRIKVADFGLVCNLQEQRDTTGGGLTPLYSAPEVLCGKPSRTSDQYSLAIVHQEMLTGEPPFAGRTSAQLAAQHHHCKPALTPLPQSDQAVVARALSKEPSKRFPGCRVLVENLLRAGVYSSGSQSNKTPGLSLSGLKASGNAGRNDADDDSDVSKTVPFSVENSSIESLPAIDLSKQTEEYRPAVFIGLGHTGVQTLMQLHQRLEEGLGDLDRIPCLQMLLIDTDLQSLAQATEAGGAAAIRGRDTLFMPLRRPHEYRSKSELLLEWLSRRWLYNIPRSLSTEGFRPLGRLALVDNCEKLIDRLRSAIAVATATESLSPSTENSGIPFQNKPPRVFIVASTAGGASSGAALDLAYLVRELLVEQGVSDDAVYGILAHSTMANADKRDLAIANTYAFITELKHLARVGGHYPGDAAFQLLASYQRDAAFQHAYLVHLGDELNDAQYVSATDDLAEFMYLNCVTPASTFFDCSRQGTGKSEASAKATVRTFAIGRWRQCDNGPLDIELAMLCRSTIHRWLGVDACRDGEKASPNGLQKVGDAPCEEDTASASHVENIVASQMNSLDLKLGSLVDHAVGVMQCEFGGDVDGHLRRMIQGFNSSRPQTNSTASVQAVTEQSLEAIDELLAQCTAERHPTPQSGGLGGILTGKMARLLADKMKATRTWLIGLWEVPDMRLDGAWQATECFTKQLGKLESLASQVVRQLADEMSSLTKQASESPPEKTLLQYGRLRVYEMAHRCVRDGVRAMRLEMTAIAEEFQKLRRTLTGVAARFDAHCTKAEDEQDSDAGGPSSSESKELKSSPRLLKLTDRQMRNRFAGADNSLYGMLIGKMRDPKLLYKSLQETGRVVLRLQSKAPGEQTSERGAGTEQGSGDIQAWIEESTPKLLACGGAKRVLMVVGDQSDVVPTKREVEEASGDSVTTLACPGKDVLLCCEMERVPLDNIAASVIGSRREYAELASRLHTRNDVDWPDE